MPTYEEIRNALQPGSGLRVVLAADEGWVVTGIGPVASRMVASAGFYCVTHSGPGGFTFSTHRLLPELKVIPAPPKRWRLRKDVEITRKNAGALPYLELIRADGVSYPIYRRCLQEMFEELPEGE